MRIRPTCRLAAIASVILAPTVLADARVDGRGGLERALGWIPEDSVSFLLIPDLKGLSDDLEQLIEATGQGGALAMGRPIDVLKAQLGVGANLDEKAPVVAYFPPAANAVDPAVPFTLPVVVVPVTDADAFLAANLKPAPEKGEGAFVNADGATLFAQKLDGRVALAGAAAHLPGDRAFRGIGERFGARLGDVERQWLARADLVAWASRDALHSSVERARAIEIPTGREASNLEAFGVGVLPGGGSPEDQEAFRRRSLEIADMLADGIMVIDVDPLGLLVATTGIAAPDTPLAGLLAGGEGRPARFDRLPPAAFYLAFAASIDGIGGVERLGALLDLAGVSRDLLPAWAFTEGADLTEVQVAAYPSKLGVAIGGALNDSALYLGSRDPARTLARIRAGIESLGGTDAGIRREPTWTEGKTLKSGAVADAFEVKETVVDATERPSLDVERVVRQFVFGSRGLHGLVARLPQGIVATFSQRPDVFGRAMEAAAGTKSLAGDPTVQAIEEWLPESRDVEAMIGVGTLARLAGQIASSFVSEEQAKALVPEVDVDAEPVALAADLGEGRVRSVLVVPAAVLKIAARAGAVRAMRPAPPSGAAPAEQVP